jgi:hypothetical protein
MIMKRKHPKITLHEPGQPIVGPEEAVEDMKTINRLLAERTQRYVEALSRLRDLGMTVPADIPSRPKAQKKPRRRTKTA